MPFDTPTLFHTLMFDVDKIPTLQNTKKTTKIIQYNSGTSTISSKIKLDQHLFSFLLEGNKSVQYAGAKVTINPSQFFLLSAGNCLMSEKICTPNGQYRSILFFFGDELLTDFLLRHPLPNEPRKPVHGVEPFLVFNKDPFLTNFIESLGLILDSSQSLSEELQQIKLEELLIYISSCHPEVFRNLQVQSYHSNQDVLIRQVVEANILDMITVEELAFLCYMTLSTFKRRFATLYGISPRKWFQEKRMQRAAQMLIISNLEIGDIYLQLGYENLSSFIQSFKQIHGTTPKQYRIKRLNA